MILPFYILFVHVFQPPVTNHQDLLTHGNSLWQLCIHLKVKYRVIFHLKKVSMCGYPDKIYRLGKPLNILMISKCLRKRNYFKPYKMEIDETFVEKTGLYFWPVSSCILAVNLWCSALISLTIKLYLSSWCLISAERCCHNGTGLNLDFSKKILLTGFE